MNDAIYAAVAQRAGLRCEYCRAPAAIFNFGHEIDHIVPVSRGGTDDLDNLALSCRACNSYKKDAQTGIDSETNQEADLFNLRRDQWAVHFGVNSDSSLHGLTPTGRATITRLRLNAPPQISARSQWAQLNLWP